MSNTSTAFQIGQIVGVLVALGFIFGIVALAIFLIVRGFQRRTTGWIVAGSIGAVVLAIPAVALVIAFVHGFSKGWQEARRNNDGRPFSLKTSAVQKVTGRDVAYSIEVPASWILKRQSESFDLVAHERSLYVGVIAEEIKMDGPQDLAEMARDHIKEAATEVEWTDPTPITIDEREWLQFTVSCRIQKVPLAYQYFVYAGPEGTFQVIGWTAKDLFDRDVSRLQDVMKTFRLPAKAEEKAH
ncbi:MAG TPA: hypothetical protein VK327_06465 [Candidatus Paceibacterota bacterium]|nr:hypothetical protein [Candidatus Paceibacterota bacterium]